MGSYSSFRISDGWLAGFKKRHNIRLMRTNGRNVIADEEGAKKFIKDFEKLKKKEDITEENIYNSQTRLNSMTESLFVDWYENNFKPSVRAHQAKNLIIGKVILLLSDCGGHKISTEILDSENFKVIYLPPNTSILIEPMNQGIIAKLKKLYHHKTLRKAATYGGMNEFHARYSIKDCIELLDESWIEVTAENIKDAWREIIPHQRDIYHCDMQHDISVITGERFSEEEVVQFTSDCQKAESRSVFVKEEKEDEYETTIEQCEIEEHKEIGELYNNRNDNLEYLFQRLHAYILREAPFIQQIFQVLKNHFLGTNK